MSAAGPSQGRPRERGEAEARRARPRTWMEADAQTLRNAVCCNEAEANSAPLGAAARPYLANAAASVGGIIWAIVSTSRSRSTGLEIIASNPCMHRTRSQACCRPCWRASRARGGSGRTRFRATCRHLKSSGWDARRRASGAPPARTPRGARECRVPRAPRGAAFAHSGRRQRSGASGQRAATYV